MLEAIAAWPMSAEDDGQSHAFWAHPIEERILGGEIDLVTGARGAGRSVLAERLLEACCADRPMARISPVTALIAARAETSVDGRDVFARYVLMLGVFAALVDVGVIDGETVGDLARRLSHPQPSRLHGDLHAALPEGVSGAFTFDGAIEAGSLLERLPAMEAALALHVAGRKVLVVVEEAPVSAGLNDELEARALTRLLSAGQRLTTKGGGSVRTIAITRNAVRDRLPRETRKAWDVRSADLAWSSTDLLNAMGLRVAHAASADFTFDEIDPAAMVRRVFRGAKRRMGERYLGGDSVWDYIWRRTRGRPREAAHFIAAGARAAIERGIDAVDEPALAAVEVVHAAYMRRVVVREFPHEADAVREVMMRLPQVVGPAHCPVAPVSEVVERALSSASGDHAVFDAKAMIEQLFDASVIGNVQGEAPKARAVFKHLEPDASLEWGEPIRLHDALSPLANIGVAA